MPLTEAGMSHIPYGTILIVRGDTIHAGAFVNGTEGDPRAHFYVYQGRDKRPSTNTHQFVVDWLPRDRVQIRIRIRNPNGETKWPPSSALVGTCG